MATLYPSILELPQYRQPSDGIYTSTLEKQRETEETLEEELEDVNKANDPTEHLSLLKVAHVSFLAEKFWKLPAGFVALDSSKSWLMFWTLHSFDLLGVPLDSGTKLRAVNTILKYLHPKGGFSGGAADSQNAHLLPCYSAVCSLAMAGDSKPGHGWDALADARQGMYDFFMRCKRPNGSFVVCEGGEVDVRGTYCLLVVATLLDLLTPELLHNVDKFIASCQTYEGGFACSSYTFGSPDDGTRVAMAEAHGGYTSCALHSHFLLASVAPPEGKLESLPETFPQPIDVQSAIRWSALMQGQAGEAGGFRGRSNKLVDGCYSWWVGGGFPILEELNRREKSHHKEESGEAKIVVLDENGKDDNDEWADEVTMQHLFNRVALQEYTLLAAQREKGGLRDKPGMNPDLYHTCNNLSGLSIAQHRMNHLPSEVAKNRAAFDTSKGLPPVKPTHPEGGWKSEEDRQRVRREAYANVLGWVEDEANASLIGGKDNRVNATTPVINMIRYRLEPFVKYFYGQA